MLEAEVSRSSERSNLFVVYLKAAYSKDRSPRHKQAPGHGYENKRQPNFKLNSANSSLI
jgi:hypothetical protein